MIARVLRKSHLSPMGVTEMRLHRLGPSSDGPYSYFGPEMILARL